MRAFASNPCRTAWSTTVQTSLTPTWPILFMLTVCMVHMEIGIIPIGIMFNECPNWFKKLHASWAAELKQLFGLWGVFEGWCNTGGGRAECSRKSRKSELNNGGF
eukprot:EG_transcript_30695